MTKSEYFQAVYNNGKLLWDSSNSDTRKANAIGGRLSNMVRLHMVQDVNSWKQYPMKSVKELVALLEQKSQYQLTDDEKKVLDGMLFMLQD